MVIQIAVRSRADCSLISGSHSRLADVIHPDARRIANGEASYWAPDPGWRSNLEELINTTGWAPRSLQTMKAANGVMTLIG
jgi:hypothetical protein